MAAVGTFGCGMTPKTNHICWLAIKKSCIQKLQTGVMGLSTNRATATSTKFGVLEQSNLKQDYSTMVIDAGMTDPSQLDLGLSCPKPDQFWYL